MSRSSFFKRSPRDSSPLLPQHNQDTDVALETLEPRPTTPSGVSASPPASFYRAQNARLNNYSADNNSRLSLSPSPSRTKPRRIQFAAPPPPIVQSVVFSPPSRGPSQVEYTGGGSSSGWGSRESSVGQSFSARDGGRGKGVLGARKVGTTDPLIGLERRAKALEKELQFLLDAQSAGLVQGFGGGGGGAGGGRDGMSDAGSSTPTTTSRPRRHLGAVAGDSSVDEFGSAENGVMPVRQPKKKAIGLRGARRGLLRDMRELVEVKSEESLILQREIERRDDVLSKLKGWEERIEGFKKELSGTGTASKGVVTEQSEIVDLQREERAVDAEIRDLEERLAQMKAKKNWLAQRISARVNRREARLSSYRFALKEVEIQVKEFLDRPPLSQSFVMGGEESFMALPASRRTLEMAREWWAKELALLEQRREDVQREREALDEGAKLWDQSIGIIIDFEDELRKQMQTQLTGGLAGQEPSPKMLKQQIQNMRGVIEKLDSNVQVAEDKGWNLLICALGAELEAFKEGEGILNGALESLEGGPSSGGAAEKEDSDAHATDDDHDPASFRRSIHRNASAMSQESEDDVPNLAELLVDHGHDE